MKVLNIIVITNLFTIMRVIYEKFFFTIFF